jgi:hypothetical protein
VILNWTGGLSASTQAMIDAIGGSIAVLDDHGDFERRLLLAAPRAGQVIRTSADSLPARRPTPRHPARFHSVEPPRTPGSPRRKV